LKEIVVIGSTGSIGCSTLAIVRAQPNAIKVNTLVARSNIELLVQQCLEFRPKVVGIASERYDHKELAEEIFRRQNYTPEILLGSNVAQDIVGVTDVQTIIMALVGVAGLLPVYTAVKRDKTVLLANKESIVCGGHFIRELYSKTNAQIIPLDSEHSAIFQLLESKEDRAKEKKSLPQFSIQEQIRKYTLTASGGPFLTRDINTLKNVTPEEAVKHPQWSMGAKISVDSATMVNKALEMIEAYWLFNLDPQQIDVLIHPQSIIHAMIEFIDGTQFAQLSIADMKGPIAFGLSYPEKRFHNIITPLDLAKLNTLTFFTLDENRFPAVSIAKECLIAEGSSAAVFNCANEIAVEKFLSQKIKFTDIIPQIKHALDIYGSVVCKSVNDILELYEELYVLL
jgi:1-deoxy-D-xylulose-5-phosphate reductoisomerase